MRNPRAPLGKKCFSLKLSISRKVCWTGTDLRHLLLLLFGLCGLVSQVHQPPEVDAAVVGQTDFTRPGGGVAVSAAVGLKMLELPLSPQVTACLGLLPCLQLAGDAQQHT